MMHDSVRDDARQCVMMHDGVMHDGVQKCEKYGKFAKSRNLIYVVNFFFLFFFLFNLFKVGLNIQNSFT